MAIYKYPPIIWEDEAYWSVSLDLDQLNLTIGYISKVVGYTGCQLVQRDLPFILLPETLYLSCWKLVHLLWPAIR